MHGDFPKMKGVSVLGCYLYITDTLVALIGINYGINILIIFNWSFMANVWSYFWEILIEYIAYGLWVWYYWFINLKTYAAVCWCTLFCHKWFYGFPEVSWVTRRFLFFTLFLEVYFHRFYFKFWGLVSTFSIQFPKWLCSSMPEIFISSHCFIMACLS